LNHAKLLFLSAFAGTIISARTDSAAWAWGNQDHEIFAIIAVKNEIEERCMCKEWREAQRAQDAKLTDRR